MTRILVVDDKKDDRYMLETLLEGSGYEVITAGNGDEALLLARIEPPDLIVTDIMMPGMDGFTLCKEWKKDEYLKDIPLIFYTAIYLSLIHISEPTRLGMISYAVFCLKK